MIESQVLGGAVGIQRNPIVDKTETSVLPSVNNGVIVGKFKRGRMDKAFRVTKDNYRAILGYEPNNPSYMAVEDAFATGISQLFIVRTGSLQSSINPTPIFTPKFSSVSFLNKDTSGTHNLTTLHSQIGIAEFDDETTRGIQYFNEGNAEDLLNPSSSAMSDPATMGGLAFNAIYELLTFYIDSTGTLTISAKKPNTTVKVELFPPKSPVIVGASPIDYNLTPKSADITFENDRFYFTLTKA